MYKIFEKLNSIISEYDSFIIMGHKDPDLDSLGSSLGLYDIINQKEKKAYLFLNDRHLENYNTNINQVFNKSNKDIVCINKNTFNKVDGKVLLIITDVHIPSRLEYPNLLDKYEYIVLDHHIKSKDYIKDSKFTYLDSNLSSMSEFVAFYSIYNKISLDSFIATILLAGLEIDTNSYNLKTTFKTYEAASILMKMGADTILKQELLKETKDEYMKRASFIRNSFMATESIALCIINEKTESLSLAETAELLLTFEDVEASFVIGKLDSNMIGISARSLGNIDVSEIIKEFGGGGHSSNAAVQISDKTLREVKSELLSKLKKE